MFLTVDKNVSLKILKIYICVCIVLVPAFLCVLGEGAAICISFTAAAAVFALRLLSEKRVYVSVPQFVLSGLGVCAAVFALFSKSAAGNIRYILSLAACCFLMSTFQDYCNANDDSGFKRRMQFFIICSSVVLACEDIVHWYVYIMPYSILKRVSFGLGGSKLCAAFFACAIAAALNLFLSSEKKTRRRVVIAIVILTVGLFLSGGAGCIILLSALGVGAAAKKRGRKTFLVTGCICGVIITITALIFARTPLTSDLAVVLRRYPTGTGGANVKNLIPLFQTYYYTLTHDVGVFEKAVIYSGIFGAAAIVFIIFRVTVLFLKRETFISYFTMILTLYTVLCGEISVAAFFLLCGLIAFNESDAKATRCIFVKEKITGRVTALLLALSVITAFVSFEQIFVKRADLLYDKGKTAAAFSLYESCAAINRIDAYPCIMAIKAFLNNYDENNAEDAFILLEKAVKRDSNNALTYETGAKLYGKTGDYDNEAQMWREAVNKAPKKDKYKLSLVKALYKLMKDEQQGSTKTKEAYNEIIGISDNTLDIDIKKKINDIADKAYPLGISGLDAIYGQNAEE